MYRNLLKETVAELAQRIESGEDFDEIADEIISEAIPVYWSGIIEIISDQPSCLLHAPCEGHAKIIDAVNAKIREMLRSDVELQLRIARLIG